MSSPTASFFSRRLQACPATLRLESSACSQRSRLISRTKRPGVRASPRALLDGSSGMKIPCLRWICNDSGIFNHMEERVVQQKYTNGHSTLSRSMICSVRMSDQKHIKAVNWSKLGKSSHALENEKKLSSLLYHNCRLIVFVIWQISL